MQRIPAITPLRAVAALLVLVSHVAFWTGGARLDGVGRLLARGDAGVSIFFAISAFLLLRPAVASPDRPWPVPRYALKRAARILPAYWCALLGVVAVSVALGRGTGGVPRVLHHVLLLQGYTQDPYQGFTQAWSLTTEITFYLLVPLVGRWMRRCSARDRSPVPVLVTTAGASIALQAWSASRPSPGFGALSTSVLGHAAWFCAGAAAAWWTARGQSASPARLAGVALTAYVLAATPLGGPLGLERPSILTAGAKEALYTVVSGALVMAAAQPVTNRWREVITSSAAQTAGDVSYGVFCWHVLVIQVLFAALGLPLFHASFGLVLVPTVVISFAVAWASWTLVERPAIAWAHRRTPA